MLTAGSKAIFEQVFHRRRQHATAIRELTAYDFYLRAIQHGYATTREGVAEELQFARRALELDPRFGLAAAVAGIGHMLNVTLGYSADPQFDRKEAVRLLGIVLSIDDSDPETLALACLISAFMIGCSIASATMASSMSCGTRFFNTGFLRLISCNASSPPLS